MASLSVIRIRHCGGAFYSAEAFGARLPYTPLDGDIIFHPTLLPKRRGDSLHPWVMRQYERLKGPFCCDTHGNVILSNSRTSPEPGTRVSL